MCPSYAIAKITALWLICLSIFSTGAYPIQANAAASCAKIFQPTSQDRLDIHRKITEELYNAEIIQDSLRSISGGVTYSVKIKVRDPRTGDIQIKDALFKARVWGDKKGLGSNAITGYGRTPMEYVAYFLNRLLGMDHLPPVAYRRNINVRLMNGSYVTEGALIHWVPNFKTHQGMPRSSDYEILNLLMRNPDGNPYNSGIGTHWVQGDSQFIYVDYAASFSKMWGGQVHSTFTEIQQRTFTSLKQLKASDLDSVVDAGFISERERAEILNQRDLVLAKVDSLIQAAHERGLGPHSVIIADPE